MKADLLMRVAALAPEEWWAEIDRHGNLHFDPHHGCDEEDWDYLYLDNDVRSGNAIILMLQEMERRLWAVDVGAFWYDGPIYVCKAVYGPRDALGDSTESRAEAVAKCFVAVMEAHSNGGTVAEPIPATAQTEIETHESDTPQGKPQGSEE